MQWSEAIKQKIFKLFLIRYYKHKTIWIVCPRDQEIWLFSMFWWNDYNPMSTIFCNRRAIETNRAK